MRETVRDERTSTLWIPSCCVEIKASKGSSGVGRCTVDGPEIYGTREDGGRAAVWGGI